MKSKLWSGKGKQYAEAGTSPLGLVGTARQIRAMESESRVPPRDGPLAPGDGLWVNLDAIVAALQIAD
jgi:hypothetical protein